MEQRNEPSTAEIVKAIRSCNASGGCMACREIGIDSDCETLELLAADRLESQERTIADLTARAEQAEKERDAAIEVITIQAKRLKESHVVLCNICEFEDMIGCVHKSHCDGYQLFKWRGLPQEGGGKQ